MKIDWALLVLLTILLLPYTLIKGTHLDHASLPVIVILLAYIGCAFINCRRGNLHLFRSQYWWLLPGLSVLWIFIGNEIELDTGLVYVPVSLMAAAFLFFLLFHSPRNLKR
jgi:hypothetical protein